MIIRIKTKINHRLSLIKIFKIIYKVLSTVVILKFQNILTIQIIYRIKLIKKLRTKQMIIKIEQLQVLIEIQ